MSAESHLHWSVCSVNNITALSVFNYTRLHCTVCEQSFSSLFPLIERWLARGITYFHRILSFAYWTVAWPEGKYTKSLYIDSLNSIVWTYFCPHHMHCLHRCGLLVLDVSMHGIVCVSLYWSLLRAMQDSWTDRDAVSDIDSFGPKKLII